MEGIAGAKAEGRSSDRPRLVTDRVAAIIEQRARVAVHDVFRPAASAPLTTPPPPVLPNKPPHDVDNTGPAAGDVMARHVRASSLLEPDTGGYYARIMDRLSDRSIHTAGGFC